MIKLGISAFFHDAAACIIKDGKVLAAVEQERFSEIKHDDAFPIDAIKWCLDYTGYKITDIDKVCWYENPVKKDSRISNTFAKRPIRTFLLNRKYKKTKAIQNPEDLLRDMGYTGKIDYIDHHLSHANFSYYTSPYNSAAILTVDGVGEWQTVTISKGSRNSIEELYSIDFPNSLGLLYSTITAYLGFKPNEGEYKVMGLAAYGDGSKYLDKLYKVLGKKDSKFYLSQKYFTWEYSDRVMFNSKLCHLLELQPRLPEEPITQEHKNLASALQSIYEMEFLDLVKHAKKLTGSTNLCLGGGCAYNGVANTKAYSYFNSIHIPFAPSDAGSAIGACLDSHTEVSPYLGPEYSDRDVKKVVDRYKDSVLVFKLEEDKLLNTVAELIHKQNTVAWFQGRMEFGSRALGNRSILASPVRKEMREKLNYIIKKREGFRPFAPSVLEDQAQNYFILKEPVPYMNQVSKTLTLRLPAATHVDGTARVQTVSKLQNKKYYSLIERIQRLSGLPVVLNTSFNLKDQTITITPEQAIKRYLNSDIDFLVINNYLIKKK